MKKENINNFPQNINNINRGNSLDQKRLKLITFNSFLNSSNKINKNNNKIKNSNINSEGNNSISQNNNNNNNINLNYIPFINSSSILEIQSQKTHSFSPNNRYTFKEDFILPKIQINKEQKTLILDLDETLIHSSFSKFVEEPDFIIEVKFY
jgi:TFIIF-interacting CTD phosphatase-like protein